MCSQARLRRFPTSGTRQDGLDEAETHETPGRTREDAISGCRRVSDWAIARQPLAVSPVCGRLPRLARLTPRASRHRIRSSRRLQRPFVTNLPPVSAGDVAIGCIHGGYGEGPFETFMSSWTIRT
jgi:hypothetical protein